MLGHKPFDLIVVGGGAAGFFGAIQVAEKKPGAQILILEKTNKLLSKVKVSGGGRCNVTHHQFESTPLSKHYPRGQSALKKLFKIFQARDVVAWFNAKGIDLKTEEDGRMFPVSNRSETIIQCFLEEAARHHIEIKKEQEVIQIKKENSLFGVTTSTGDIFHTKNILVAIGGNPKMGFYQWLTACGHSIKSPIPSLFTFNDKHRHFTDLMGVSVTDAEVMIEGTRFRQHGPVLITHWGLSGPAVIKLSAWAAEYLSQQKYSFVALVNWLGDWDEERVRNFFFEYKAKHPRQRIVGNVLFDLPQRLWEKLCELSAIELDRVWSEISKKSLNKLIENLVRCRFDIGGKTTFKEEFVTCGGIPLDEVDLETMESKRTKGLHFAGEVLDIDGETGGFNFQSAWTTAYVAASAVAERV